MPTPDHPDRCRQGRTRLRAVLPWLVAVSLLAWLFHMIPAAKLRAALESVSIPTFAALVLAFVVVNLAADTAATWATFRYCLPGVALNYLEVLKIRGATYLLAILNYSVGQGGIALFLSRRYKVPIGRAVGAVMLTMGVNAVLVAGCAGLGVLVGGAPASPTLRWVVLALGVGFLGYLAVIAAKPALFARRKILAPLFEAGLGGHLVVALARLPHIAVLLAGHYAAMRVFGVAPPPGQALALLPVLFIVATLPVSPMGLGTAQATAVALFTPFAIGATLADRQAAVMAYSLSLQFTSLLVQALIGLVFLPHFTAAGNVDARE